MGVIGELYAFVPKKKGGIAEAIVKSILLLRYSSVIKNQPMLKRNHRAKNNWKSFVKA